MRSPKFLAVGLSLFALANAAQAQQTKGAPQPLADIRETFQQLDANGDMAIDRDEVPESGREAFERLLKRGDSNKNGKLDAEELRDLVQKLQPLAGLGIVNPERFKQLDKDGDGKVSKAEFPGAAPLFDRFDLDKDGQISPAEVDKFREANPQAAMSLPGPFAPERLKAMDKDGDGKISRAEFTGPAPAFDRADADKDGFVTAAEIAKFRAGFAPGAPAPRPAPAPTPKSAATGKAAAKAQRFRAMDKDGDGKISRAEFTGRPALFDRLDADKDGFLTRDEFLKAGQ